MCQEVVRILLGIRSRGKGPCANESLSRAEHWQPWSGPVRGKLTSLYDTLSWKVGQKCRMAQSLQPPSGPSLLHCPETVIVPVFLTSFSFLSLLCRFPLSPMAATWLPFQSAGD